MRQWLLDKLAGYSPFDSEEALFMQNMRSFVEENPDCCSRQLAIGHVTSSAWIVNREHSRVLLTHHAKLDRWLQLGGHIENDTNILASALREAREESGLREIKPLNEEIFDLDIHPIPARKNDPDHLHYDVRFLFTSDDELPLQLTAESHALRWFSLDQVLALNEGPSINRMVSKTLALG